MTRTATALLSLLVLIPFSQAEPTLDADEALLRGAKIATDGPGLVAYFKNRLVKSEDDQKKIDDLIQKLGSQRFRDREQAAEKLVAIGISARAALVRATMDKDLELRMRAEKCLAAIEAAGSLDVEKAVLRLLRERKPEQACAVLLAYFPTIRDEPLEEETLQTLAVVGFSGGKADPALLADLKDKDPVRRGVAMLLLGWRGTAAEKQNVQKLLASETEPLVRLRGAQGLIAGKDGKALALLLPLLSDAPLPVAEQARDLLAQAAGDKAVAVELAKEPATRKKCRDEWERWFDKHGGTVDLAKAGFDVPWQNLDVRARRAAMGWVNCMIAGDLDGLSKVSAFPFSIENQIVFKTKEEFDSLFGQAIKNAPKQKIVFTAFKVQRLDEAAAFLQKKGIDFQKQYPRQEIRMVTVTGKSDREAKPEDAMLFVHIRGNEGRVFGIASGRDLK